MNYTHNMNRNEYKLNGIWRLLSRNLLVKHTHNGSEEKKKKTLWRN